MNGQQTDMYAGTGFDGLTIVQVEPGTEIFNPRTGEQDTVTDERAIGLDLTIYVTPKSFEAIKARVPSDRAALLGRS